MAVQDDFRAALAAGDFRQLRRISEQAEPHLARLSEAQAERVMHDARTRSSWLPLAARLYSHRWLDERGLDSNLPDELRPNAEQVAPRIVSAVGIAVKFNSELLKPATLAIRGAMEEAVLEAEADGRLEDSPYVRARMLEARTKTTKALFGNLGAKDSR